MATNTRNDGRLALACVVLTLCAGWAAFARADAPAKPLTAEERGKLQKEATELDKTALRLYRDGQYGAVTDVLEKSLAIQRKLYPTDLYPKGRPEVAASLSTLAYLYQLRGEYDKAEASYREALQMRPRFIPATIPTWLRTSIAWASYSTYAASMPRRSHYTAKRWRCAARVSIRLTSIPTAKPTWP